MRSSAILPVVLLICPAVNPAGDPLESARFELHSAPCVNLHHFLYHEARNKLRGDEKLRWRVPTYPEDRAVELQGGESEAWRKALEIYAGYAERSLLFSGELTQVKNDCAKGVDVLPDGPGAEPAYEALRIAMPIYERHWWPRHDSINRKRMENLQGYLARYENALAKHMARDYESEWPDEPIRVDLSVYSGHHGAYATEKPNQIIYASGDNWYPGLLGLEILFHEAGHTYPLNRHVRPYSEAAAQAAGVEEDRLWHAYFFYAVAEATDQYFPEDYVPYPEHYGLWDNGFGEHFPFIEKVYSPERDLAREMKLIHEARAAENQ